VVTYRAGVGIVTGQLVRNKLTSKLGLATIVGASVAVIAGQHLATATLPEMTCIIESANITVIARH